MASKYKSGIKIGNWKIKVYINVNIAIMLYIWYTLLCMLVFCAVVTTMPALWYRLCSYAKYVYLVHTSFLFWVGVVTWWIICIVINSMGVAEAYTPSQDIYLQLFMKYRCMGMSMRNVTLHELHQHGIHMAAYQASSLPKAGYYYLSLAQTRTLNEGDALIYNLITGHGVLIQNKAAVQAPSDYNKIAGWLHKYDSNTQLLSYGVYEQFWYDYVTNEVFTHMRGYREQNKIGMDCITYRMDIPLTKNKALDLEEAISINSLVVTIDLYNEFIQAYSNSPHIKVENLTTEQVLEQFTCGLRSFIGDEHVAVLSEM